MIKNSLIGFFIIFFSFSGWTQQKKDSRLSYDVSASAGNEDGKSYTEINLGLNWSLQEWLKWRNSIFSRQGSQVKTVQGLDSSLRLTGDFYTEERTFGFETFLGPGVRIASDKNSAAFAEAGLVFKLGGIKIGGGVKSLSYFSTRETETGTSLPKSENQYFIILSGAGTL